jgi:hypothetical protein
VRGTIQALSLNFSSARFCRFGSLGFHKIAASGAVHFDYSGPFAFGEFDIIGVFNAAQR